MDKKQANNLLRRIYRALKNETIEFGLNSKLKGLCGICDATDGERVRIEINPKENKEFFLTLIHEALHLVDYENEDWVQETESKLFEALSDRQLMNLLKKVVRRSSNV